MRELGVDQQREAERLVLRLVHTDELSIDTRRRASVDDLSELARRVAERFAQAVARLLVADRDEGGRPTIEISHETLLTSWDWLRDLVERNREFLSWRKRLGPAVEDFVRSAGREPGALLRGRWLADAQAWVVARGPDLSEGERALVRESLRHAKRHRSTTRWKIGIGVALIPIAIWAGIQSMASWKKLELGTLALRMNPALDALDRALPTCVQAAESMREVLREFDETLLPTLVAIEDTVGVASLVESLPDAVLRESAARLRARITGSTVQPNSHFHAE